MIPITIEKLKSMSNLEINELCAIKVMGWTKYDDRYGETNVFLWVNDDGDTMRYVIEDGINEHWNPAEDMNDAMLLYEKLTDEFDHVFLGFTRVYAAYSCSGYSDPTNDVDGGEEFKAISATAPLSICYAASLGFKVTLRSTAYAQRSGGRIK